MTDLREELSKVLANSFTKNEDQLADGYADNILLDGHFDLRDQADDILEHLASIGLLPAAIEAVRKGEAKVMPREPTEAALDSAESAVDAVEPHMSAYHCCWVSYQAVYDNQPDWSEDHADPRP